MSDVKTIDDIIKERDALAGAIGDMIDSFLRANPNVIDVDIDKTLYSYETHCGIRRDLNVNIKLIL